MSANLSLVLHFLVIVSAFTLFIGLVSVPLRQPFMRWTSRFEPGARLSLLRLFSAAALFGGLAIALMVSLPSLGHGSKLPLDHCHNMGLDKSQLDCTIAPVSHVLIRPELMILSLLLVFMGSAAFKSFLRWRRSRRLIEQIENVSHKTLPSGVRLIESKQPLAFTLGIFKSFAVLSTGLVRLLTQQQLDIICLHEETHTRHQDNKYKWALDFLCAFHLPPVRRALLDEHALVMEIRADQQVAQRIADPVAVAETIVAMQRLIRPVNIEMPICQFIDSPLERRVQSLLAQSPGQDLPKNSLRYYLLAILISMIAAAIPAHKALETFIQTFSLNFMA